MKVSYSVIRFWFTVSGITHWNLVQTRDAIVTKKWALKGIFFCLICVDSYFVTSLQLRFSKHSRHTVWFIPYESYTCTVWYDGLQNYDWYFNKIRVSDSSDLCKRITVLLITEIMLATPWCWFVKKITITLSSDILWTHTHIRWMFIFSQGFHFRSTHKTS